jgi:hypothetical protein
MGKGENFHLRINLSLRKISTSRTIFLFIFNNPWIYCNFSTYYMYLTNCPPTKKRKKKKKRGPLASSPLNCALRDSWTTKLRTWLHSDWLLGHDLQAPKKKKKKTFDLCLINDLLVSTRYHPQLSSAQRFHNPTSLLGWKNVKAFLSLWMKRGHLKSHYCLSVIPNNRRPLTGYWIQQFMGVAIPRYNGSCEPIPSH